MAQGIPTVCDFFGMRVAEELRASGQRASVLHANNVLAHVPDITGVLQGAARGPARRRSLRDRDALRP